LLLLGYMARAAPLVKVWSEVFSPRFCPEDWTCRSVPAAVSPVASSGWLAGVAHSSLAAPATQGQVSTAPVVPLTSRHWLFAPTYCALS
jgi:hypothetical protein